MRNAKELHVFKERKSFIHFLIFFFWNITVYANKKYEQSNFIRISKRLISSLSKNMEQFISTEDTAIAWNQARKWNLSRTKELKHRRKGKRRIVVVQVKNTKRSKERKNRCCSVKNTSTTSANVWEPDADRRNYNCSGSRAKAGPQRQKSQSGDPRYNLVNPMQVPGTMKTDKVLLRMKSNYHHSKGTRRMWIREIVP